MADPELKTKRIYNVSSFRGNFVSDWGVFSLGNSVSGMDLKIKDQPFNRKRVRKILLLGGA
jgi:hypothetical protein